MDIEKTLKNNPSKAIEILQGLFEYKTKQNSRKESNLVITFGCSNLKTFKLIVEDLISNKNKYWADLKKTNCPKEVKALFDDNQHQELALMIHPLGPMMITTNNQSKIELVANEINATTYFSMKDEIDYFENKNPTIKKTNVEAYAELDFGFCLMNRLDELSDIIHKSELDIMPWQTAAEVVDDGEFVSFKVKCSDIDSSHDVQKFLRSQGFKYLGFPAEVEGKFINKNELLILGNGIISFCDEDRFHHIKGFTEVDENFLLAQGDLSFFKRNKNEAS